MKTGGSITPERNLSSEAGEFLVQTSVINMVDKHSKSRQKFSGDERPPDYHFMPGDYVQILGWPTEHEFFGFVIRNAESKGGQVGHCDVILSDTKHLPGGRAAPQVFSVGMVVSVAFLIQVPIERLKLIPKPDAPYTYAEILDDFTRRV